MVTVEELLAREYTQGVTVTNCVKHMHSSILERPRDCELCQTDIRNVLARALGANEWLNVWKNDATALLGEKV